MTFLLNPYFFIKWASFFFFKFASWLRLLNYSNSRHLALGFQKISNDIKLTIFLKGLQNLDLILHSTRMEGTNLSKHRESWSKIRWTADGRWRMTKYNLMITYGWILQAVSQSNGSLSSKNVKIKSKGKRDVYQIHIPNFCHDAHVSLPMISYLLVCTYVHVPVALRS